MTVLVVKIMFVVIFQTFSRTSNSSSDRRFSDNNTYNDTNSRNTDNKQWIENNNTQKYNGNNSYKQYNGNKSYKQSNGKNSYNFKQYNENNSYKQYNSNKSSNKNNRRGAGALDESQNNRRWHSSPQHKQQPRPSVNRLVGLMKNGHIQEAERLIQVGIATFFCHVSTSIYSYTMTELICLSRLISLISLLLTHYIIIIIIIILLFHKLYVLQLLWIDL